MGEKNEKGVTPSDVKNSEVFHIYSELILRSGTKIQANMPLVNEKTCRDTLDAMVTYHSLVERLLRKLRYQTTCDPMSMAVLAVQELVTQKIVDSLEWLVDANSVARIDDPGLVREINFGTTFEDLNKPFIEWLKKQHLLKS